MHVVIYPERAKLLTNTDFTTLTIRVYPSKPQTLGFTKKSIRIAKLDWPLAVNTDLKTCLRMELRKT